jgi:H+/Cl- antiporter ClcA
MNVNETSKTLRNWYDFNIRIIFEGILVGLIVGIITVLFRVCITYASELRTVVYKFLIHSSYIYIVGWFFLLIIAGIILGLSIKKTPNVKGSGIPQVKGFLLRQINLEWLKEMVIKFFGSIISLGFGLSLGREGPSVQLGADTGLGVSKLFNSKSRLEEKYLVTAGASAGLAAAFNAPLAGVMFALEELHKNFSPIILTCAMGAAITSNMVSEIFFGLDPVFKFTNVSKLPLKYYGFIIILGILAGIFGKLFNFSLVYLQDKYKDQKIIKDIYKPVIPLVMAGILGFVFPSVLGGGHELIMELTHKNILISILLITFIVKLLFTVISYGSGVPGGIFMPILVLGALIGKGFGQIFVASFNIDEIYLINFMILVMAAYFTAVVKAPITGSILITEMTGSFDHLFPLIIICLVAYVTTDIINCNAIYDTLLEKSLANKKSNWLKEADKNKVVFEISVVLGAEIEHKKIKDITWPNGCLIVGVRRGEKEIIPNGDMKIYAGDFLIIIADENNAPLLKPQLIEMASEVL